MTTGLQSLIQSGSTVWLDSVDPQEVAKNKKRGITGATSNPAIIAGLVATGRFDDLIHKLSADHSDDEDLAWAVTDHFVSEAQKKFHDVWVQTEGNDGWVSFELDPLLEDPDLDMPAEEKSKRYIELGKRWAKDQPNRMIKVPATPGGLGALEELAAAGITLNVTLIFTPRQYEAARDAVWKGRQRAARLDQFKSVYSIFVSRVDVYTKKQVPELSEAAQGRVGIVNATQIGIDNERFWADKGLKLKQQMIFASTGAKLDWQEEDYYVKALAGSDILTNPPETNDAIAESDQVFKPVSRELPDGAVVQEIQQKVDLQAMEDQLMAEGVAKFADPHKQLLETIKTKRQELASASS